MIFENNDRLVFAGDSVTAAGSTQPVGDANGEGLGIGFVRIFDTLMAVGYPEINVRIFNSGISGNNSRALRTRFADDVLRLRPDWIFICVGINDVWRYFDTPHLTDWAVDKEHYRENLLAMITASKETAKKGVFVMTPYYMEPNKAEPMRSLMDEYGEICKELAREYSCELVDFQAVYDEYLKYHHSSYIAADRIHPNQKGAALMAIEVLKHCGYDFNRF